MQHATNEKKLDLIFESVIEYNLIEIFFAVWQFIFICVHFRDLNSLYDLQF